MRVYLIRHGRQDSKLCNANVGLSREGREQAALLGARLQRYGIESIYASSLARAIETAEILGGFLKKEVKVRQGLQEISFGKMENRTDEDNLRDFPEIFTKIREMKEDIRFPGGECGQEVFDRGLPALEKILQEGGETIAIVTHGVWIRSLVAGLFGSTMGGLRHFGLNLENTGITELLYDPDRKAFFLERFNDHAHLENHPLLLRGGWKKGFGEVGKHGTDNL